MATAIPQAVPAGTPAQVVGGSRPVGEGQPGAVGTDARGPAANQIQAVRTAAHVATLEKADEAAAKLESENANRTALTTTGKAAEQEQVLEFSPAAAQLPVELDVAIPVRKFRVRNLLGLAPGQLIESQWANGEDLPLSSGEVQLAWTEFEVIDSQLAVRVTRLA